MTSSLLAASSEKAPDVRTIRGMFVSNLPAYVLITPARNAYSIDADTKNRGVLQYCLSAQGVAKELNWNWF